MDMRLVDTTFRDGSQSLWASGMRTGMRYFGAATPLLTLIQELGEHRKLRFVHVQRGADSLFLQNRWPA